MTEQELRDFLEKQDRELKGLIVDRVNKSASETSARLLVIEQHLASPGGGGRSSQSETIAETKAPIDPKSGLPVLSHKHKLLDNLPPSVERRGLDLAKFLRGCVTGNWTGAIEERKTLDETTNPSGGYLLVPELSAAFIDFMRAAKRWVEAG